jgi:hypothetical protein
MAFKKGQSGNPGGRPKLAPEVQALLEQFSPEAIMTLAEIMRDKKAQPSSRVAASLGILRKTVPDLNATDHTTKGEAITGVRWLKPGEQPSSHTSPESNSKPTTNGHTAGQS